jgi:N-acyl-D-amino-acid deacylase
VNRCHISVSHRQCALRALAATLLFAGLPALSAEYDLVIRGGMIIDGSGGTPFTGDVAVLGERIAVVDASVSGTGATELDAAGLAVSPGFIDVESSAYESLPQDGRGVSDITQGITLTVFGEEPHDLMNDRIRAEVLSGRNVDFDYPITWNTLDGFLDYLEQRGVSENIASLTGITSIRKVVVGWDDRAATPAELARMQELVRQAMRDGAVGVGICLSYDLAKFTNTAELTAMAAAAAEFGGVYSTGLRSESGEIIDALDEAIGIGRNAGVKVIVNHAKVSGAAHWDKLDAVIARIEAARAAGVDVYTDMYHYPALWTALSSAIPPWAVDGGFAVLLERLRDPESRRRILTDMRNWTGGWDNYVALAGRPENVIFLRFKNRDMNRLLGKTLADAARELRVSPEEAVLDLLLQNGEEIWSAFFTMSEDNIRRQVTLPWMMFGSDSMPIAAEEPFTLSLTHPRTYGSVARLLSDYVRDQELLPLQEAVRKLSALPAVVFGFRDRGRLKAGYFADVVVFDPAAIEDHATFTDPHRYSTGVRHVFVNGTQVLKDGVHTGAKPGHVIRGPGWVGRRSAS